MSPKNSMNVLSFDIEEWFLSKDANRLPLSEWNRLPARVEQNTHLILSLLEKHHQKATFFILGWIAEKYPELVEAILKAGHEIGYHSFQHRRPNDQSLIEFEKDLLKGIRLLENIQGSPVLYYRAPMFSLHGDARPYLNILLDVGIVATSTFNCGARFEEKIIPPHPFEIALTSGKLLEFPLLRISTYGIRLTYSGSGYMRVLPYSFVKKQFEQKEYNMAYFHPRDFDSSVPFHLNLGIVQNTLNSLGNSSLANKFDQLLHDFTFLTLSEARIAWKKNQKINPD